MAMTLLDYQELLRNLPQEQIVKLAKKGDPRSWMAGDELRRREEMYSAAAAEQSEQETGPRNIMEEYIAKASGMGAAPPQGPPGGPPAQQMASAMPPPPQAQSMAPPMPQQPMAPPMPQPPMAQFQRGGPVKGRNLARMGRGGDTQLMHVGPGEVNRIGTSVNPQTGLPEAFGLSSAAGMALGTGAMWLAKRYGPQVLKKLSPNLRKLFGVKGGKAATETIKSVGERAGYGGATTVGGVAGGLDPKTGYPISPGYPVTPSSPMGYPRGKPIPSMPSGATGAAAAAPSAARNWLGKLGSGAAYAGAAGAGAALMPGFDEEETPVVPDPTVTGPGAGDKGGVGGSREEGTGSGVRSFQDRIRATAPGALQEIGQTIGQFGVGLGQSTGDAVDAVTSGFQNVLAVPEQMAQQRQRSLGEEGAYDIAMRKLDVDTEVARLVAQSRATGKVLDREELLNILGKAGVIYAGMPLAQQELLISQYYDSYSRATGGGGGLTGRPTSFVDSSGTPSPRRIYGSE
jgi:hypothetical protein